MQEFKRVYFLLSDFVAQQGRSCWLISLCEYFLDYTLFQHIPEFAELCSKNVIITISLYFCVSGPFNLPEITIKRIANLQEVPVPTIEVKVEIELLTLDHSDSFNISSSSFLSSSSSSSLPLSSSSASLCSCVKRKDTLTL